MANPYNEIYRHLFGVSEALGYETYDYLPDSEASYPFVFLGEQFSKDVQTKTKLRGNTNIIIHIFSYERRRKDVEMMMDTLNRAIYGIGYTTNFYWIVNGAKNAQHIFHENQDGGSPLVHGVLDVTLEFLGKGE